MKCHECEQEIKNDIISKKDVLALNKKLLGRGITRYFCAECLAEYLGIEKSELPDLVEQFKQQGCTLF
jgi:DNA-directed RNA polymerase subunit RPC12/RpoP